MDTLTPEQRSERMARIRGKDTAAEMFVRRLVHGLGYRYRLHRRDLPGRPDLVFSVRKKIIFVHGCFWHRHEGCKLARLPKSRMNFWETKLEGNRKRDLRDQVTLFKAGWDILVIWECELGDHGKLSALIVEFLERGGKNASS